MQDNPQVQCSNRPVVGGVDTHKDLHIAAVVDEHDRVLDNQCFASTRQGYRKMLAWMQSFGEVTRVGVECTGTYGAGLLRYLQQSGVHVVEVTAPDKTDRRKRVKTIKSMRRMRRTPPSQASARRPPRVVMG